MGISPPTRSEQLFVTYFIAQLSVFGVLSVCYRPIHILNTLGKQIMLMVIGNLNVASNLTFFA